jgi:hypothetical protein
VLNPRRGTEAGPRKISGVPAHPVADTAMTARAAATPLADERRPLALAETPGKPYSEHA